MADTGAGAAGQTGYIHVPPAPGLLHADPPPSGTHHTWPVDYKRAAGIVKTLEQCVCLVGGAFVVIISVLYYSGVCEVCIYCVH